MQNNPYTPPESPLKDEPRPPGSPVKSVLVGLAICVGGSLLVGVVVTALYGISLISKGMKEQEVVEALANIPSDSWANIVKSLAGALLSFLGGFSCACIARRSEYRLGFILAALAAMSGLAMSWQIYAPTQNLLLTLSSAACVLLGTKYGRVSSKA